MPDLLPTPDPALAGSLLPRPFRVRGVKKELEDTNTLELEPAAGGESLRFEPGQFTMLYVFGIGEIAVSISGDAGVTDRLIHTVREVGAVSRAIVHLKRGAVLGVRGPFGSHWPLVEAEGKDILVIAGGVGLAPLRPAILHLIANRSRYGRVAILVGARNPETLLYPADLEKWRGRFDLDVRVTVDRAGRDWRGDVGVVTQLVRRAAFDGERAAAFVCGPEVMMRFAAVELLNRGLSPDAVHLSMERNMKCAVALCGHCQFGPNFVCKDGPVFPYSKIAGLLRIREI